MNLISFQLFLNQAAICFYMKCALNGTWQSSSCLDSPSVLARGAHHESPEIDVPGERFAWVMQQMDPYEGLDNAGLTGARMWPMKN